MLSKKKCYTLGLSQVSDAVVVTPHFCLVETSGEAWYWDKVLSTDQVSSLVILELELSSFVVFPGTAVLGLVWLVLGNSCRKKC